MLLHKPGELGIVVVRSGFRGSCGGGWSGGSQEVAHAGELDAVFVGLHGRVVRVDERKCDLGGLLWKVLH